jgi:hypothetical protein
MTTYQEESTMDYQAELEGLPPVTLDDLHDAEQEEIWAARVRDYAELLEEAQAEADAQERDEDWADDQYADQAADLYWEFRMGL